VVPDAFHDFFVACGGVSGALIGLLFVATAVAPERIVRDEAPAIAQETAVGAYLVLSNALFVSLGALNPELQVGGVAIVVAIVGIGGTLMYAANTLLHRADNPVGVRWVIRRLMSLGLYAWELAIGITLTNNPDEEAGLSNLALVTMILFAIGLARAWELLGGRGHGIGDAFELWRRERAQRRPRP
jgi:hypothetical protein